MEKSIKQGETFEGSSHGAPALWKVTRSIKKEDGTGTIYCTVIEGNAQTRKYTRHQFGYLIRSGIITLKGRK